MCWTKTKTAVPRPTGSVEWTWSTDEVDGVKKLPYAATSKVTLESVYVICYSKSGKINVIAGHC